MKAILRKIRYFAGSFCDRLFRDYLHQVLLRQKPTFFYLTLFCLAIPSLIALVQSLVPTSAFTRLLLNDPMFHFGMPLNFDWITLLFCLNTVYFHLHIYAPSRSLMFILWQILNVNLREAEEIQKRINFFISNKFRDKCRLSYVTEVVQHYARMWFYLMQYFALIATFGGMFIHFSTVYHICQDYLHFTFFTSLGYLSLVWIVISSISFDVVILTYTKVNVIWSAAVVMFTMIFFIKFRQVNGLLLHNNPKDQLVSTIRLHRFIRHHTRTLTTIFEYNRFFGRLLLAFIVLNFPPNSYIIMEIVLNHFNDLLSVVIFVNYITGEYIIIVLFHLLAAMYSNRIHACAPALNHWSAQCAARYTIYSLKAKVSLALYIDKFHVKNRYGITYASLGLMSFVSFSKFMILYGKFLIYWYKMNRRK